MDLCPLCQPELKLRPCIMHTHGGALTGGVGCAAPGGAAEPRAESPPPRVPKPPLEPLTDTERAMLLYRLETIDKALVHDGRPSTQETKRLELVKRCVELESLVITAERREASAAAKIRELEHSLQEMRGACAHYARIVGKVQEVLGMADGDRELDEGARG